MRRNEFDKLLADEIAKRGVTIQYNATVIDFQNNKSESTVSYKDENDQLETLSCKYVIDASGYGQVIPKLLGIQSKIDTIPRGAIFAHFTDTNQDFKAARNIYIHSFNNKAGYGVFRFK